MLLWCLFWQIGVCPNGCVHHHGIVELFNDSHTDHGATAKESSSAPSVTDLHVCDGHGRASFRSERSKVLAELALGRLESDPIETSRFLASLIQDLFARKSDLCASIHLEPDRSALQQWQI